MSSSSCAYAAVGGTNRQKNKIRHMLNDFADAEDVMQDACVKVLEAQRGSLIENAPAFFYRAANNIAIDRVRRQYRTKRIFVATDYDDDIRSQASRVACTAATAEDEIEVRQALDVVCAEIETLPPKCARAYIRHCGGEATYAEIASELQVTASMVEKYVARARRHLRDTYQHTRHHFI